jgi:deazaflavin-dependent oxidoreductase (nitroreductase family)
MTTTKPPEDLFGQEHVRAYRETDGEHGYRWRKGTAILLLSTKGRKSGETRTTPLIHRTDGDGRWVIIASKGGHPEHPGWYENIRANPDDVSIQVKADVIPVTAYEAEGEERDRLWAAMTEVWPDYEDYAEKTDREIPVVVLERRA